MKKIFLFTTFALLLASCTKETTLKGYLVSSSGNSQNVYNAKGEKTGVIGNINRETIYAYSEKDVKTALDDTKANYETAKPQADNYKAWCSDWNHAADDDCHYDPEAKERQLPDLLFAALQSKTPIAHGATNIDGPGFTIKVRSNDPVYIAIPDQQLFLRVEPKGGTQDILMSDGVLDRAKLDVLFANGK